MRKFLSVELPAAPAQEYCVLCLSKEHDAQGLSKVLSQHCSASSEAGYTLRNHGTAAHNVSSIRGYGNCDRALLTDGAPPWSEYQDLPTPYVGDRLNDDIDYVHAFDG